MARRSWAASGDGAVDEQVAQAAIAQRLQMADALRQRGMAGASLDQVGGRLIGNPFARALSSGLDTFRAGREQAGAERDAAELATAKRERLAQALGNAGGIDTPEKMIEYGTRLLADPATSEVGQFYIQSGQRAKDAAARSAAEEARWGRQDKVAEDRFNRQESAAERRHRERMEQDAAQAAAKLAQGAGGGKQADPYSTVINTTKYGQLPFDTRTQKVTLPGIGPVDLKDLPRIEQENADTLKPYLVKPSDDPEKQRELETAKGLGKMDAKYWATRPAAKAAREQAITDLKKLRGMPGFRDIFGAVGGRIPNVMPAARDANAQRAKVVGQLTAENRAKLVGQGSVSDYEGRLMERLSTVLSDPSISDEMAAQEVDTIISDLETGKYALVEPSAAEAQAGAASGDDDLVNKYLNGQP